MRASTKLKAATLSLVVGVTTMELSLASEFLNKTNFHPGQIYVNETVQIVVQLAYDKMNQNWSYVQPGSVCSTESKYWKTKEITVEHYIAGEYKDSKISTLILDCSPDDIISALLDLIRKPALLECKIALQTANLLCMQHILGDADFTLYAQKIHTCPQISADAFFLNLSNQFLSQGIGQPIVGAWKYLTNVSYYPYFKPNGNSHGINVFYMGENKYLGFGSSYKDAPQSLECIETDAFRSFCNPDDLQYNHLQHKKLTQQYSENYALFKNERDKTQETKYNYYQYFDISKFIEFEKNKQIRFQKLT